MKKRFCLCAVLAFALGSSNAQDTKSEAKPNTAPKMVAQDQFLTVQTDRFLLPIT